MTIHYRWATMLIVAGLSVGVIVLPHETRAAPLPARARLPAEGIDYTPIGSAHAVQTLNARRPHRKQP